ncbi:sugar ABC transporter substrate-binding protein [Paractinoplanes atraurantiacus]|uniref:D-xylose transport system substrate-binding protein n=1 Tax=Paractinoplanes atraurantiacus TaxID=1036182 RepID=A0A285KBA0_9ACTN|nr:substrate-binding domain-containing protein [Actinoplanes atraurantiacus]SNY69880.1 D-xylose transport system substrate-binding protein [Actinoplanes atraurantiacus]
MRTKLLSYAAACMLAAGLTACSDAGGPLDDGGDAGSGNGPARVGVIMPDRTTTRWAGEDSKYLTAAFGQARIPVDIQNAEGDRRRFVRIGRAMVDSGVKVLIIANIDSASGKEVLDLARKKGIPTIDYDRLTLNGGADYYVSFDNVKVGELQAYGLIACLKVRKAVDPIVAQLNGSRSDNNASLFKRGYDAPLNTKYDAAQMRKGPEQWVPDWDPDQAAVIFEQMLDQAPGIRGVLAANDGIAGSVIKVLRKRNLNGVVPVTGQDATLEGLRNILTGEQCMTVYKAIKPQALSAAKLAIELFNGGKPIIPDKLKDPESGAYVPFVKLKPVAITARNINTVVVTDKFVSQADLCQGEYLAYCKKHGVGRPVSHSPK